MQRSSSQSYSSLWISRTSILGKNEMFLKVFQRIKYFFFDWIFMEDPVHTLHWEYLFSFEVVYFLFKRAYPQIVLQYHILLVTLKICHVLTYKTWPLSNKTSEKMEKLLDLFLTIFHLYIFILQIMDSSMHHRLPFSMPFLFFRFHIHCVSRMF